jgi:hypothetical protein
VFFTHLHPDHTGGVSALGPQTEFVFGKAEASFLARAAVANHFPANAKFFSIDFPAAPSMPPLGPCVDLLGDGSFWAISAPGHTDDDMAFLIDGASPVLLTGDASHFAWAFKTGVGPRGWNDAGTARGRVSLERLRAFASLSERKTHLRTRSGAFLTCAAASWLTLKGSNNRNGTTAKSGGRVTTMTTILGAGGPIGNELAKILAARNRPFRLVGRNPRPVAGGALFPADLADREQTIRAVAGSTGGLPARRPQI